MVEQLIIASAWVWGVHCLFSEGMILEKAGYTLERIIGTTICKPLFLCPPCQSSIHGLAFGLYFYGLSFQILIFIICLTGLNYAIKKIIYPDYEDTSP